MGWTFDEKIGWLIVCFIVFCVGLGLGIPLQNDPYPPAALQFELKEKDKLLTQCMVSHPITLSTNPQDLLTSVLQDPSSMISSGCLEIYNDTKAYIQMLKTVGWVLIGLAITAFVVAMMLVFIASK